MSNVTHMSDSYLLSVALLKSTVSDPRTLPIVFQPKILRGSLYIYPDRTEQYMCAQQLDLTLFSLLLLFSSRDISPFILVNMDIDNYY